MDQISSGYEEQTAVGGSLAKGVLGIYDFNIKNILKESWHKISGFKWTYWKAFFLIVAIMLGLVGLSVLLLIAVDLAAAKFFLASEETIILLNLVLSMIIQFVIMAATAPLFAGMMMLGIKRSVNQPISAKSIFHYYRYWHKLWVLPFIMLVFSILMEYLMPYKLITLPLYFLNIYIAISYLMFYQLIAEKNLDVWQALEASRKAISHHWFKMFWFILLFSIMLLLGILTLGIAWIWLFPLFTVGLGILYREMFGVETKEQTVQVI